jgi:hypothetical protein
VLPANHHEIFRTVTDTLPEGLSVTTKAPLTTVLEPVNRPETSETIVHFVNFDQAGKPSPFAASVKKQYDGPVKSVMCFSPDIDEPVKLTFKESQEHVTFIVPAVRLYSMVVIEHR